MTDSELVPRAFLASLRAHPSAADALDQLGPEEWEPLLELAIRQRVAPLLGHRLKACGHAGLIPAPTRARWKEVTQSNATRNLILYHDLSRILRVLHEDQIPVVVLKGAHLAAAQGSRTLCFMNDVDILVPREQAVALLQADGYSSFVHSTVDELAAHEHHWPRLHRSGGLIGVEVHWGLLPPGVGGAVDEAALRKRAVPLALDEAPTLGLCPEDLLLQLCLHLTHRHLFEQGCDIDVTLRRYAESLDWD